MTTNEAVTTRMPTTKHGRYVLDISRSWHFPAFDVNDILIIEKEAAAEERRATVELLKTRVRTIYPDWIVEVMFNGVEESLEPRQPAKDPGPIETERVR